MNKTKFWKIVEFPSFKYDAPLTRSKKSLKSEDNEINISSAATSMDLVVSFSSIQRVSKKI